jgi:FkbM family methyltransferase
VTADLRSLGGLARSLVVYRARPWKTAALARLYAGIVAPGDLAFDIGAHAGNRTRALVQAGARVVALEPQRLFHAWLARDLPAGVTLLPLAAGRAPGRARLAVSRLHPTVSSLADGFPERMHGAPGFGGVRWDAAETVEVTTLDALIAAHGRPRFAKIDVEGFEAEVLAGLSQPLPWLAVEYLPEAAEVAAACVERLAALGDYAFNLVPGETATFALPRWLGPEAIGAALASARRSGDLYARLADG